MSIRKIKKAIKRCIRNNNLFSIILKNSDVFCTNVGSNIVFKKDKLIINGMHNVPYSSIYKLEENN